MLPEANPFDLKSVRLFFWLAVPVTLFVCWSLDASRSALIVAGGFAMLLALLGAFAPAIVRPIYQLALLITRPIGMIVSEILVALLFLLLLLPVAICVRTFRWLSRKKRTETGAPTWHPIRKRTAAQYFKRF